MNYQYSNEEMQKISVMIVSYLDSWNVKDEYILSILGLPKETKVRLLQQVRKGSKMLPQTDELLRRIEHVVGITEALRTTFPFSESMRIKWLHRPHRRFQKQAPLMVILKEGLKGLQRIRVEVDCSYSWTINESLKNN